MISWHNLNGPKSPGMAGNYDLDLFSGGGGLGTPDVVDWRFDFWVIIVARSCGKIPNDPKVIFFVSKTSVARGHFSR